MTDVLVARPDSEAAADADVVASARERFTGGKVPTAIRPGTSQSASGPTAERPIQVPETHGQEPTPTSSNRIGAPTLPALPGAVQNASRTPDQSAPMVLTLPRVEAQATDSSELSQDLVGSEQRSLFQMPVAVQGNRGDVRRFEEIVRFLDQPQAAHSIEGGMPAGPSDALPPWAAPVAKGSPVASAFSANLEQLDLPDQIVRAIRVQWQNGVGEARLRLNPANLGDVSVSLQVRQGSVSAVLSAESEAVRHWIRANQHELKAALEAQGLKLDQMVVEEDGRRGRQPEEQLYHGCRRPPRRDSFEPARFEVRV